MYKKYKKIILIIAFMLILLCFGSFFSYYLTNYHNNTHTEINDINDCNKNNYIPLTKKEIRTIEKGEKILVAVSIIPQSEFVEKIGKDKLITITMIPPGSSHNYDPSPKQLEDLLRAKVYIMLNSGEPFEEKYMKTFKQLNSKMKIIDSSENIQFIVIENKKDPHIWLSPKIALIMVENIFEGLIQIDPINYEYYKTNKELYSLELENLNKKIEEVLISKKNKSFIVYHPAWSYFSRDYGLTQIPIELDGKEPTPKSMERLIVEARKNNIKVVFVQEQMSKKVASSIASEINGTVVTLNPLAKNYIENMEYMANIIAENMN